MNLWGVAPLIAAALLSGGTGVHGTAANHGCAATFTPSLSVGLLGAGAPSPVLRQVGPTHGETTVLLNDTGPAYGQVAKGTPRLARSCQLLVVFAKLGQVSEAATRAADRPRTSSTVTLPVSRNVTLFDYLGIPAITGAVVAILSLLGSALFVWWSDRKRKKKFLGWDWLQRPILGSGAWTANDSWATNISSALVVVATVLVTTTTTNSLFPGVALDRFAIVNIVAGFFVAAAPVVFGILYSLFTAHTPGLTADATVRLPRTRPATISVPSGASITMAADATIQDRSARWAKVRGGSTYQIPPGAEIRVLAGIQTIAEAWVTAPGVQAAVQEGIRAARHGGAQTDVARAQAGIRALRLAIEQAFADAFTQPGIPVGEPPTDAFKRAVSAAVEAEGVRTAAEKVIQYAAEAPGPPVPQTTVTASVQRIIKALAQAVPPNNTSEVGTMACPGNADIGVLPGSTLQISALAGMWTIPASDVLEQSPAPRVLPAQAEPPLCLPTAQPVPLPQPATSDVLLPQMVLIGATGGAKVTVAGAAGISLPEGAVISAPRQPCYTLPRERRLLAPQGTDVIVANLGMILTTNIFTMFGIGAELGIAGVLAGFSSATGHGRGFIFLALAAVAVLVVLYAVTATRTMADPQPGSSISSQAGASFTL
jgi:hypothetical protein